MCGIAGIFGTGDRRLVEKMTRAIKHRGPDDEGYYVDENVSLGHRRLSIIDLKSGRQPITNEDGTAIIVFNGEIYNHASIRKKLEKNHEFKTRTDTEVLVHLYEEEGINMLHFLDGMFAFALFDAKKNTLFMARDPLGIKPLFYAVVKDCLVFGSEMKSIFASELVTASLDINSLKERAVFDDYFIGENTFFDGVKQLEQGHFLYANSSKDFSIHDFWKTDYSERKQGISFSEKKVLECLKKSVSDRLMSDVPIGTLLSGGLDSSIISAIHRELIGDSEEMHTFSVSDETGSEDFRIANKVAEHLGSKHHEFFFGKDEILEFLPSFVYHLEDIEYGIIYNYFLNKETKKHATVVLSGNGSDEIFAGYERFKNILGFKKKLVENARKLLPFERKNVLEVVNSIQSVQDLLEFEQLKGQLSNFQLAVTDRNSMAFGVEVRVPFLQKDLVSFSNSIPLKQKIFNGTEKYVLRKAASRLRLPLEVIKRKKVPAGLENTTPKAIPDFEKYCKKMLKNRKKRVYDPYIRKPGKLVCMDVLFQMYVENCGKKPSFCVEEMY
jgi:asparagine synthase (glutamine-hydrolysing)